MEYRERTAIISDCGHYRYELRRTWANAPYVVWVMFNPSTADAAQDDPTIRRCVGFSNTWGYGGIVVVNLFAYRTKSQKELLNFIGDPIGPDNEAYLRRIFEWAAPGGGPVICAWGAHGKHRHRDWCVYHMMLNLEVAPLCLPRKRKPNKPNHPLYLPGDLKPAPFILV